MYNNLNISSAVINGGTDESQKQMKVKNKWNGKIYTVLETNETDNTTTLKRDDGSQFTIQTKELYSNYRGIEDEHGRD